MNATGPTLKLLIRYPDGEYSWRTSEATNPDDALTELSRRGVYNFAAGDRLRRACLVEDKPHGRGFRGV